MRRCRSNQNPSVHPRARARSRTVALFVSEITPSRLGTLGIHRDSRYDGERPDATSHENAMTYPLISFSFPKQVPRDLSYRRAATILARDVLRATCRLSFLLPLPPLSLRTRVIRGRNDKSSRSHVRSKSIMARARSTDARSPPQTLTLYDLEPLVTHFLLVYSSERFASAYFRRRKNYEQSSYTSNAPAD